MFASLSLIFYGPSSLHFLLSVVVKHVGSVTSPSVTAAGEERRCALSFWRLLFPSILVASDKQSVARAALRTAL